MPEARPWAVTGMPAFLARMSWTKLRHRGIPVLAVEFNLYGPRETNLHILPEIFQQMRTHPDSPLRLGHL